MSLSLRSLIASSSASILLLTTGCSVSHLATTANAKSPFAISGHIHGGQQPISGASIQLFAANTTTLQGASSSLLTTPVSTLSDGSFSITGDYSCGPDNPLVYIVATGGNPGLPGTNISNPGSAEMALLGNCNDLIDGGANTFIWIDELTTVISVQALAPFMKDYADIGSSPTGLSGIGNAFDSASQEVNFSTGAFANSGSIALPELTLNTLADIIAACVNTDGTGSPCSDLYSTTGASNTIAAALQIVKNPGENTTQLYNLINSNSPFQPYFSSVPSDFTATVGYTLPDFVQAGTLDSKGHIWLYFGGSNYDPATDTSTDSPGYIAVYDSTFTQLFTIQPGSGGLYYPTELDPDANGNVYAINSNNTISKFSSGGNALSAPAGWPTGLSSTFSPTGPGNTYSNNPVQGGPLQIDALGNIFGAIPDGADPSGNCYFELDSNGNNITPSNATFCSAAGISSLSTGSTDGSGNAWGVGQTAIAKVNASGNLAASAPASQGCFYTDASIVGATNLQQAVESTTTGLQYDHVNNQLWGYSLTGAGTVTDTGVANFCDFGATMLPVTPGYQSTSTTPGDPFSAGGTFITGGKLDGAGNFWFSTGAVTESGVVGTSAGTFTGTATYASYLSEITPAGVLNTPYNPTGPTPTYGLQPTGFGANANATSIDGAITPIGLSVALLGIDTSGNIWALDSQTSRLLKITGLAAANTVNY